jgi:hypothetical protein
LGEWDCNNVTTIFSFKVKTTQQNKLKHTKEQLEIISWISVDSGMALAKMFYSCLARLASWSFYHIIRTLLIPLLNSGKQRCISPKKGINMRK